MALRYATICFHRNDLLGPYALDVNMSTSEPPKRPTTLLESIEDLRQELKSQSLGDEVIGSDAMEKPQVFRPSLRPPMAMLYVYDDDPTTHESIRIRGDSFVIGREEGDLSINHDQMVSTRHAEITREQKNGLYQWYLSDLGSMNGTFARVSQVILADKMMLIIGSRRYRFDVPLREEEATSAPVPPKLVNPGDGTRHWKQLSEDELGALFPSLVVVSATGDAERYTFCEKEHWIGRDPANCSFVIDDPMVESRHAKIFKDEFGNWCMKPTKTTNGLWAQVHKVPLGRNAHFQCGEQRFGFCVL